MRRFDQRCRTRRSNASAARTEEDVVHVRPVGVEARAGKRAREVVVDLDAVEVAEALPPGMAAD